MSTGLLADISIFVLAILVGFEVISKVPSTLHTPLMSASNAIHGIVFVGVMVTAAEAHDTAGYVLSFIAAAFAAMNVVGGYMVTDRMLEMFKKRPAPPSPGDHPAPPARTDHPAPPALTDHPVPTDHTANGSRGR